MAFATQSTKKRGRNKKTGPTNKSNYLSTSIALPSKALGDKHETISMKTTTFSNGQQPSIQMKTPTKKPEPKLSRSAQRRRSIQAAEESYALANAVPILDIQLPLPPVVLSRTYQCTLVEIHLIPNLSHQYQVSDFQLQVSKGGKQLDSLRPINKKELTKKGMKLPLAETKLKWSTVKRVPVSIPKEDGNGKRLMRLVSDYNVVEKCAFRCRIRYNNTNTNNNNSNNKKGLKLNFDQDSLNDTVEQGSLDVFTTREIIDGWSPWSRVGDVQQPVESGLPADCGRCIAFDRTQSSLRLKWPAPRREILEYYGKYSSERASIANGAL